MRKTLIVFIYFTLCASITTAMAFESSESFSLYTNNATTTDETADDVAPETVPVDGGTLILIALAGGLRFKSLFKESQKVCRIIAWFISLKGYYI